MKECPKCKIEHEKPGTYCSRKCANSRTWNDEVNAKRSAKLIGKKLNHSNKPVDLDKWREKLRQTRLNKYLATPFDELGMENRRRRVFEEQNYCCNRCGIDKWQGFKISLELEHKDGNTDNNSRENLEGLCPNCHSITDTWRGRNKPSKNGKNKISDEFLLQCLLETENIRQALLKAGLAAKGKNYERAKDLLLKNISNPDIKLK
jgi:hypothetical protein